jgi:hypothetical protein
MIPKFFKLFKKGAFMAKRIFLIALIFVCFAKCAFAMQSDEEKESNIKVKKLVPDPFGCLRRTPYIKVKILNDETLELNFERIVVNEVLRTNSYIKHFVGKLNAKVSSVRIGSLTLDKIKNLESFFSSLIDLNSLYITFVSSDVLSKLSKVNFLKKKLKKIELSFSRSNVFGSEELIDLVEVFKGLANLEILTFHTDQVEDLDESTIKMLEDIFSELPKLKFIFFANPCVEENFLEITRK